MNSIADRKLVALLLLVSVVTSLFPLTPAQALDSSESDTPIKILVPLKIDFKEFVSWSGSRPNVTFTGFSVEVFRQCVQRLPSHTAYEFVPFGDGSTEPDYDAMVNQLVEKKYHGIVADITITEDRIKVVDFTQPYIQSTLMMVVPFRYGSSGQLWDFLVPFSERLWASIVALFCFTGLIIFIVEHDNPHFVTGLDWRLRLANVFWFTSMTVFFAQRERISTKLGRILVVFWLLVVLILSSSYTASLASILTAQKTYPSIERFEDLLYSNLRVGHQVGSFTEDYLQRIGFRKDRLVGLTTAQSYSKALQLGPYEIGGIAALLDEQPYAQVFLNEQCHYATAGNQIAYFGGFAFAFQKNSTLTNQLSIALLSLEQDLELQRLRDGWLGNGVQCKTNKEGTQIAMRNFEGLFICVAVMYSFCAMWRFGEWGRQAYWKAGEVRPVEDLEAGRCENARSDGEEMQYRGPE